MSGGGGGSSTTKVEPWGPSQVYLKGGTTGGGSTPIYASGGNAAAYGNPMAAGRGASSPGGYGGNRVVGYDRTDAAQVPGVLPESADLYEATKGLSPAQEEGFGMIEDYARSDSLNQFIDGSMGGLEFLTSGDVLRPDSNPYLRDVGQAYADDVNQMLNESVFSDITDSYAVPGSFTDPSKQYQERGIARRGAADRIADNTQRLYSDAYNRGLGAMTQGLSMAPGYASFGALPGQMLSGVGGSRKAAEWDPLMNYSNVITNVAGTGRQQVTPQSSGGIAGALGGASAGAGMASALGATTPWGIGLTAAGGALGLLG